MIHVSSALGVVAVPARPDIANLFPHATRMTVHGQDFIALPHDIDETRVLRTLGLDVPAPVLSQYRWPGERPPFEVQKKTVAMLTTNPRAYVLNGMGTGKTRSALWAWDYLSGKGHAGKLLVVAPLSTLTFTWAKEIFEVLPHHKVSVLYGTKERRLKRLADPDADIFVVNHDGVSTILDELMKRGDIDTLIIDELATYRNGSATRTKVMRKLAAKMKWVWGLTGSPTPNEPTDAWAQASIITPDTTPKYMTRFRDQVMVRLTQFKWAPKRDSTEAVFRLMQPAVRFTLDDVVELPDLIERTIDVDLGPKQRAVYEKMKASAYAAIAAQEVTAQNAGAVLNKLLQISAGWVYASDGSVITLDGDLRLDAICDAVQSTEAKVLTFVPFVHALNGIAERLTKEGNDVRVVSGATAKGERDETFRLFQCTDRARVLVAHPQCMAHGLTLTAADTIIWAAPTTSLELFEQANARIRRIGQRKKQQVLMIQSTDAERRMYSRLRAKQKVQNLLLDMFAENT
jgi:SNF2 family DNA or RNA helicase